jgi:SAM-dependent methyltransferase
MERVREEWARAWQKIMPDYNGSVYEELSSPDNQEFLRLLGKYIGEGTLVLEAGCGYGRKCVLFTKYYKANVVGVDIVLEPLKTLMSYLRKTPSCTRFTGSCRGWGCNETTFSQ